jgi:hypothetical protein
VIGAALLAVAVIAVVATISARGPRQDGPLKTNGSFNISYPLADDEVFVWGTNLPWNGDAVVGDIGSIRSSLSALAAATFPPPEVPTRGVSGAVLSASAGRTCSNDPSVLVGVRWLPNNSAGRIDALRMLYRHQGIAYELDMPYSLDICRVQPDAQGRRVPCTAFRSPTP